MGPAGRASADPAERARDKALRLLAVRSRAESELRQRLQASGFSQEVAGRVLERLRDSGLIDDRRFAFERARSMGKGKGWGPRKLRADLRHKGIDDEVAEEAVRQAYGSRSCRQIMRRLVVKRFGQDTLEDGADRKLRGKAQRYLMGKGFEPDEVQSLFEGS